MADGLCADGKRMAVFRMRNVDALPVEYRHLVHRYGYAVHRLWVIGWSVEMIEAQEKRNGVLSAKARRRRHIPAAHAGRDA